MDMSEVSQNKEDVGRELWLAHLNALLDVLHGTGTVVRGAQEGEAAWQTMLGLQSCL